VNSETVVYGASISMRWILGLFRNPYPRAGHTSASENAIFISTRSNCLVFVFAKAREIQLGVARSFAAIEFRRSTRGGNGTAAIDNFKRDDDGVITTTSMAGLSIEDGRDPP